MGARGGGDENEIGVGGSFGGDRANGHELKKLSRRKLIKDIAIGLVLGVIFSEMTVLPLATVSVSVVCAPAELPVDSGGQLELVTLKISSCSQDDRGVAGAYIGVGIGWDSKIRTSTSSVDSMIDEDATVWVRSFLTTSSMSGNAIAMFSGCVNEGG